MHEVLRTLSEIGIVPVVALKDAADAVPLARALCAGGIPTAEVTFRTDAAAASIAASLGSLPSAAILRPNADSRSPSSADSASSRRRAAARLTAGG